MSVELRPGSGSAALASVLTLSPSGGDDAVQLRAASAAIEAGTYNHLRLLRGDWLIQTQWPLPIETPCRIALDPGSTMTADIAVAAPAYDLMPWPAIFASTVRCYDNTGAQITFTQAVTPPYANTTDGQILAGSNTLVLTTAMTGLIVGESVSFIGGVATAYFHSCYQVLAIGGAGNKTLTLDRAVPYTVPPGAGIVRVRRARDIIIDVAGSILTNTVAGLMSRGASINRGKTIRFVGGVTFDDSGGSSFGVGGICWDNSCYRCSSENVEYLCLAPAGIGNSYEMCEDCHTYGLRSGDNNMASLMSCDASVDCSYNDVYMLGASGTDLSCNFIGGQGPSNLRIALRRVRISGQATGGGVLLLSGVVTDMLLEDAMLTSSVGNAIDLADAVVTGLQMRACQVTGTAAIDRTTGNALVTIADLGGNLLTGAVSPAVLLVTPEKRTTLVTQATLDALVAHWKFENAWADEVAARIMTPVTAGVTLRGAGLHGVVFDGTASSGMFCDLPLGPEDEWTIIWSMDLAAIAGNAHHLYMGKSNGDYAGVALITVGGAQQFETMGVGFASVCATTEGGGPFPWWMKKTRTLLGKATYQVGTTNFSVGLDTTPAAMPVDASRLVVGNAMHVSAGGLAVASMTGTFRDVFVVRRPMSWDHIINVCTYLNERALA